MALTNAGTKLEGKASESLALVPEFKGMEPDIIVIHAEQELLQYFTKKVIRIEIMEMSKICEL